MSCTKLASVTCVTTPLSHNPLTLCCPTQTSQATHQHLMAAPTVLPRSTELMFLGVAAILWGLAGAHEPIPNPIGKNTLLHQMMQCLLWHTNTQLQQHCGHAHTQVHHSQISLRVALLSQPSEPPHHCAMRQASHGLRLKPIIATIDCKSPQGHPD
jgi:hypothetical protein